MSPAAGGMRNAQYNLGGIVASTGNVGSSRTLPAVPTATTPPVATPNPDTSDLVTVNLKQEERNVE